MLNVYIYTKTPKTQFILRKEYLYIYIYISQILRARMTSKNGILHLQKNQEFNSYKNMRQFTI